MHGRRVQRHAPDSISLLGGATRARCARQGHAAVGRPVHASVARRRPAKVVHAAGAPRAFMAQAPSARATSAVISAVWRPWAGNVCRATSSPRLSVDKPAVCALYGLEGAAVEGTGGEHDVVRVRRQPGQAGDVGLLVPVTRDVLRHRAGDVLDGAVRVSAVLGEHGVKEPPLAVQQGDGAEAAAPTVLGRTGVRSGPPADAHPYQVERAGGRPPRSAGRTGPWP